MRKILVLLFLLVSVIAEGRKISESEAAAIASSFFNSTSTQQKLKSTVKLVRKRDAGGKEVKEPYYVYNADDEKGFVIISGDDRAKRILGYSDSGSFDFNNLPPQLVAMLDRYAEQIASIPASTETDPSWSATQNIYANEGVLLETANWGQGYPYNAKCPEIDGVRCPTGCVATAMAIVMKYHNWPESGRRTHTYWNYYTNQMHTTDFSTFYPQWKDMLPSYKEGEYSEKNAQAVAELMLQTGMATNMQYSPTQSGTGVLGVMTALRRFFNYTAKMDEVIIEQYGSEEWKTRVRNDIDNNCPVFYYGEGTGAHAFIIDGYEDSDYFHINWGWDGSANGYFTLDNLCPEGWYFTNNQGMVAGIHPATKDDEIWSDFFMADDKYFGATSPIKKINPSVENIIQNEPFSVAIPTVGFPPEVTCKLGVAIVDKEHAIKQVLGSESIESIYSEISCALPAYGNLVATCPIDDTDSIQIVVKEEGESKWLLVCDSKDVKSSISVKNNVPYTATVHWDVDPRFGVEFFDYSTNNWSNNIIPVEDINNTVSKFLIGAVYQFHPYGADANRGIFSAIKINDVMSDITVNKAFTMRDKAIRFIVAQPRHYDIKIMGLFPGDELTSSIEINNEGDLQRFVKENECAHITDFTISGIGTNDDYVSISNNMPFIAKLDMSAYQPIESKLPDECFAYLPNLSKVILPENVTTIGARCFIGDALDNITIPSNVTYIGDLAFINYSESNLSAVFCKAATPPAVGYMPFGNNSSTVLYVLPGSKELYSSHPYWGTFSNIIEDNAPIMDIDVITIDGIRYKIYSDFAEVIGPEKDNCPDEVTLPETIVSKGRTVPVTNISYHAFLYSSIKKVTIPESIVNWASGAFSCCYDLTDVDIKAPIKELPLNTFENCISLTNIKLPNTIEVIGQYAITSSIIKTLQLPASLKEIQWNGVIGLRYLEEIILPEENKNFNLIDGVLYSKDMTWLYIYPSGDNTRERFVIPEGVTNTFWNAISGNNLREVVIPNSMTELTRGFIYYAPHFERLVLHDGIITLPGGCFPLPKHLTLGKNLWKMDPQDLGLSGGPFNVYCNNINTLTDFILSDYEYSSMVINYYSGHLTPNIILSSDSEAGSHLFIPCNAKWEESNFKNENIHYMWDYRFNRTLQAFSLINILPNVEILGVKVNGEYANKIDGIYHYYGDEIPDVTIEYCVNDRQTLTTEYPSDFNASLPDQNLILVETLTISPEIWSGTAGETFQITATLTPENATNKTLNWSTSDATIATVDNTGLVSILKEGACEITASTVDGSNLSAKCIISLSGIETGIESLFADGIKVDVYNINGVLLKRGCGKTELKSLTPGIYIVRDKNEAKTIVIF